MPAEQLERARLGGRGEGEEADVRLLPARGDGGGEGVLRFGGRGAGVRGFGGLERGLGRGGAERRLEVLRGLAGLGAVRLVHDDREPALPELGDLVQDERELLERRDDDPALLARQSVGRKLRAVLVDPGDDARRVLELVDRLLELAVEDHPVGDDDHLVEDGPIVGAVEAHQPVGEPGDRVALARARAVLDEVRAPGALRAGGRLERADGVPLVVAREDRRPVAELGGLGRALARGDVDEAGEDVEPGVARPELLPEVAGAVAGGVGRRCPCRRRCRG